MGRKIDFLSIGIVVPPKFSSPFSNYHFDIYTLMSKVYERLSCFGLTGDESVPIALYYYDAVYEEKPWPPDPPFDAPEHYTGPTFDAEEPQDTPEAE